MAGDGGVALAQREMLASESDLGWLERPLLLGIGRRDNLRTAGGREGRNGFGTSLVDCDNSTIETSSDVDFAPLFWANNNIPPFWVATVSVE